MMRFEQFTDDEIYALHYVLKDRHACVSTATRLFCEVLLEMHRRGYVTVSPWPDKCAK